MQHHSSKRIHDQPHSRGIAVGKLGLAASLSLRNKPKYSTKVGKESVLEIRERRFPGFPLEEYILGKVFKALKIGTPQKRGGGQPGP